MQLLITDELMLVIWQSLDLGLLDQTFWGACSLGYLGFLQLLEFTVLKLSTVVVLHSSTRVSRTLQKIRHRPHPPCTYESRVSKTHPFQKSVFFTFLARHPLCAVHAMMTYLASRGDASGPLFLVCEWAASHQYYSY